MSSLICFPNKLEKPGSGVRSEFAFAGDGSKPAEDGAAGEGVDFMGASCSPDPGDEAAGECGKRLSDSLWASEDLSCSSEIRRDAPASRGSPEWTGAADAQRAISLDASECLTEMSNQALVRSTALEDLTSIGDRSTWVDQDEEQTNDAGTAAGAGADSTTGSGPQTQQPPGSPDRPPTLFDSQSEDLHPENHWKNISQKDGLFTKVPSGTAAENSSSDSSVHAASFSKPDISGDSDSRSDAVQTTGTAELQKTTPQTSPARRSLVPVPIFKGLFAAVLTVQSPLQLTPPTSFIYNAAAPVCYAALSLRILSLDVPTRGEARCPPSPLSLLFHRSISAHCWSCSPKRHFDIWVGFCVPPALCVAVHAAFSPSQRSDLVSLP